MAPKKTLTLNEQLALLNDPAPGDFDPEALDREFSDDSGGDGESGGESGDGDDGDSDDDDVDDANKAREHYVEVGKSALRAGKKEGLASLGRKYEGARVSRDDIYDSADDDDDDDDDEEADGGVSIEDVQDGDVVFGVGSEDDEIDSDDALGSEDDEKFSGWKFGGSTTTNGGVVPKEGHKVVDSDDQDEDDEDGGTSEEEDDDDGDNETQSDDSEGKSEEASDSEDDDDAQQRRALSKMMAEEKKSISENIAKAAQTDAEKGEAVRQQQRTFDSFLSARIKLQKALTAINTLPATALEAALPATPEAQESWKAAEASALKLWNTLHTLRLDITSSRTPNLKKRKASEIDESTPTTEIWTKMAKLEAENTPWRDSVLEKWSNKTQTVATVSVGKKLDNAAPRSLTSSIRETLSTDRDRLVSRTRVPRSCAPVQAQNGIEQDAEIFDDTDLYQRLLKALVDQRMVDSSAGGAVQWTTAMRDSKKKKNVDTKASKGRKLRYHVHEKIQNFMAPLPNNGWQESQVNELFLSLLGQRVSVEEDDEMEDAVPNDGLRLFR